MFILEYFRREGAVNPSDAETNDSNVLSEEPTVFYKLAQWCVLTLAFLLPVWFLPITSSPVILNKAFMVGGLIVAAFLFYLIHSVVSGSFLHIKSWVLCSGLLAVTAWGLSSLISTNPIVRLLGLGGETTSFLAVLLFFVLVWLVASLFADAEKLAHLFIALISGFGLMLLYMALSFFGAFQGFSGVLGSRTFNPIGSWNSLALAGGFFVLLSYPFLLIASGIWKYILYVMFFLSLVMMLLVNYFLAWWLMLAFGLVILSYSVWKRAMSGSALVGIVIILAFAVLGLLANDSLYNFANALNIQSPIEVGVNHTATFSVIREALSQNLLFGKGPGTFGYLWDMYRPVEVNQTPFWGVRFSSGSSYLLSTLAEVGLVGWGLFVAFILGLLYLGLKNAAANASTESGVLSLAPFLLLSYSVAVLALYPAGFTLVSLGFLSMGLVLASYRLFGTSHSHRVALFGEGLRGFVSALFVVLFIIGSVSGAYLVTSRYVGQIVYAQGLRILNSGGDFAVAEKKVLLASNLEFKHDVYLRTLSQLNLEKAAVLLQNTVSPQDLLTSDFADVLDSSLRAAQEAKQAAPMDFLNYRNLGKIYEFLVPLNTTGAAEAAIREYDEAIKRAPTNPSLYRDKALVYLSQFTVDRQRTNLDLAEEALLKSVDLKPDYAVGHFNLAQVFGLKGNEIQAINRAEAAALIAPNDIGALFQLGILYYRGGRLADAEAILARAVQLNNNYSNARYFLGLVYDRTGRKAEAIEQFAKVLLLNPGNAEVQFILTNLNDGKTALDGIVPPAPAPERRQEPPISDSPAQEF